ncbi:MAG TPA: hypothetical protein VMA77_00220 [Solirubrobacteraceae bacterium]|nr:hypothetical protein [Solirubrobacteraceae bacterium]
MATQSLGTPVLSSSALRSVNFFNGRLLTGDDLAGEQSAQESRLRQLGQLTGAGVAYGLEVQETAGTSTTQNPVVTVNAGLALSLSGLSLWLPASVDLSLAGSGATTGTEPGGLFAPCQPYTAGTYTAGAGVYLLWMGPASQGDGLAPVNGLGNQVAPCNVDDYIDTVTFGLIRIALTADQLSKTDQLSNTQLVRNLVAYACFAPDVLASLVSNPFGAAPSSYGLIDNLRSQLLTADQVPLAIIGWDDDNGIEFVDLWSVRRRVTPRAGEGAFGPVVSQRRRAEGEAMFLQFQAQVQDYQASQSTQPLVATTQFAYLPPAGLLPAGTSTASGTGPYSTFFSDLTVRGAVFIEGARVLPFLRASLAYPPIDTSSPELVWLYTVRENAQPSSAGTATQYVIFARGDLPYPANAHFDVAHWDYANYALQ